jgi:hypothetical protein
MSRLTLAVLAVGLLLLASPASAYVWRCHTPSGDVWTSQPPQYGDCEEYDGTFNPNAAPPIVPSVEYAPPPPLPPAPPVYAYPYPYPVPVPYPYYPPPRRFYYGGPGLYLGVPPLVFEFRFGGGGHGRHGGHGGHFRGHRWR